VLQYEQVFQQKKKDFLKIVKTRSIRPVQWIPNNLYQKYV
jgi:hypothetical protein